MSPSSENDGKKNAHSEERLFQSEPHRDWHIPLFETNSLRVDNWFTYLWCFCEVAVGRMNQCISVEQEELLREVLKDTEPNIDNIPSEILTKIKSKDWQKGVTAEIRALKEIGKSLDRQKDSEEEALKNQKTLNEFIESSKLKKPDNTSVIQFFDDQEGALKKIIHDLKNAHTIMFMALITLSKDETSLGSLAVLLKGMTSLYMYARQSEQILKTKTGEIQALPLEQMNLFQLLEAIELTLQVSLRAEDPAHSVQLVGLEQVRAFIQSHPDLMFMGRQLDFEGLLANIGKNCVEQYWHVKPEKFPLLANDPRPMFIRISLIDEGTREDLQGAHISLSIQDRATGYTPQILTYGFKSGESEKKNVGGWGEGMGDYTTKMAAYIKIELRNFDYPTGNPEFPLGIGGETILLIPVHEKKNSV